MPAAKFWKSPQSVLVLALLATLAGYFQTLDAPLFSDDYIYLDASRQLSFTDYARLAFTPWSRDPVLPFTRDFWRPLSFLYFEFMQPVFGNRVLPYHLVNLSIHMVSVALVWQLARKLDPRPVVAGVAVLLFALYPGSTQAVSWISTVNSAGLPLMLLSWLAFLSATHTQVPGWGRLVGAAALLALALMFRETSASLLVPIGFWYLLVQRREQLRQRAIYRVFLPYAGVCVGYYLIRTKVLSEPFANPDVFGFGSDFDNFWWYYIKNALLPLRDPVTGWRVHAQTISGAVLLSVVPAAFVARRWSLLALTLGMVVAVVPTAAALLGAGQRYFYFLTPVLAVGIGIGLADMREAARRRKPAWNPGPATNAVAAFAVAILGTFIVADRNQHWEEIGPDREQLWVNELREEYPSLPEGGMLYCVNVPLELAVFDAANLLPTVRWYYPEIGNARRASSVAEIPALGPNDRIFIAADGLLLGDTKPQR